MSPVATEPSICIPRTLANVTWFQVKDTFEQLIGRGTVERVDIVSKNTDDSAQFCRIFVHFRYWPNKPDIMAIRQRLLDGETIKVVYDTPWFWKCSASRIPKPVKTTPKTAPYIEFADSPTKTSDDSGGDSKTPVATQTNSDDNSDGDAPSSIPHKDATSEPKADVSVPVEVLQDLAGKSTERWGDE
jgi:hypothetical protein